MLFFVVLTRFGTVAAAIRRFIGFFYPVLLGCLIAYIINPLSRFYGRTICKGVKKESGRLLLANVLAIVSVLLIVALLLLVSLPQLIASIALFARNLPGYIISLESMLVSWNVLATLGLDSTSLMDSTASIMESAGDYLFNNITDILSTTIGAGKGIVTFALGFILSIYLLAEKNTLKAGVQRLLNAMVGQTRYEYAMSFFRRCDAIMNRYIIFNIIDSLVVGALNAVFMLIARMPYAGLVSFVVACTNLIPTFGPIIGAAIGAFLLVLVKPWYALLFLIFTLVLQTCDGYIIKPRLFGNSLGVSSLWIMVGVIVGGRMFGIGGILVAIPVMAILDYTYRDLFMPWLEQRREAKNNAEEAARQSEIPEDCEE